MITLRRAAAVGVLLAGAVAGAGLTPAHAEGDAASESSARGAATAAGPGELTARAQEIVAGMDTAERAAAVVMGHLPSTDPTVLAQYMRDTGIGGFILMGANVPGSEDQLRAVTSALQADPDLPPLIGIDQEGGDVSRLPWDDNAGARTLKNAPVEEAATAFAARAALVARAGATVNFGVVADVTDDSGMFIYPRALGTTPQSAADHVVAAVRGEAGLVLSTVKHFPGHGAAPGDSHQGIPTTAMTRSEWEARDGAPFRAAIEAGVPLVMLGHLAYTDVDVVPASLSTAWHDVLREDLGFTGVAITDDLGMLQASGIPAYDDPIANAVTALRAGNDMVLSVMFTTADTAPAMVAGITSAVEAGTLPAERLEEAATRVTTLRLSVAAQGDTFMPCGECADIP
ncbi:glycoside hydrolase family 3 N-terminal domain-containing protein [Microbacterium chocolatum]|uniref:glycoside hydrolase family 3 N-terminal domain-containing protein n=1 Tax=Microbacterium aurantiacum TaxID=162393 RepID=UPI00338E5523